MADRDPEMSDPRHVFILVGHVCAMTDQTKSRGGGNTTRELRGSGMVRRPSTQQPAGAVTPADSAAL